MGRISPLQLAVAGCLAFLILVQGISAPFQKDAEPQSAEWIVSVVLDGNWLTPRDYYGFIERKPPLYYWLSALVTEATGGKVDETKARIVSVLCAELIALEVLTWTASEIGLAQGWLAFLFLLSIYGFSSRATLALTDMLMTALLMSTYLLMFPLLEGRSSRIRVVAAGVVLGFGILAKGPVVVVLIALAALIFLLLSRENPFSVLRSGWPWQMTAIALAIAACWYVPWFITSGQHGFIIFFNENFGHFAPADLGGTGEASRPFWYILARLVGGANPIILLMPATLAAFATGEVPEPQRKPLIFQTSLFLAVVLFFSLASAKRDDYILPALPGVAILSAAAFGLTRPLRDYAGGAKIRDGVSWLIAFAALLAVVLALITARRDPTLPLQSTDAQQMMLLERGIGGREAPFMLFLAFSATAAIATVYLLTRGSTVLTGASIGLLTLGGVVLMNGVVRPDLARARSCKSFLARISGELQGHPVFVVRDADFELSYYYGRGLPALIGRRAAVFPAADVPSYLIARNGELAILPQQYRAKLRIIARSNLLGRDGPPALYLIEGPAHDLNAAARTGR